MFGADLLETDSLDAWAENIRKTLNLYKQNMKEFYDGVHTNCSKKQNMSI